MKVFIASKSERFDSNPTETATLGVFESEEEAFECLRKQEEKDMADLKFVNGDIKFVRADFNVDDTDEHFRGGHFLYEDEPDDDEYDFRDITLGYIVECYEIGKPITTNILDMF